MNRQALGRGLSALIPKTAAASGVDTVDIDLIVPNPHQPRLKFDPEALRELADSIREHGVLQPVVVTQVEGDAEPRSTAERDADNDERASIASLNALAPRPAGLVTYQLIAGERRLQAARMAGVTRMPVVIREAAGTELLEIALVENLQREDLNPLEEASAFKRLADEFAMTQEQIAKRVGRSRTAVANTLRLLALEEDIRVSLASGQITEGHARALLGIEDSATRLDAWRRIVADSLTVRQAEEIARVLRDLGKPQPRSRDGAQVKQAEPYIRE